MAFQTLEIIMAHTLHIQQVRDLCLVATATMSPSFKRGFAPDQINTEESQISQPWQLCLLEGVKVREQTGSLDGGRGESILSREATLILYMIHTADIAEHIHLRQKCYSLQKSKDLYGAQVAL